MYGSKYNLIHIQGFQNKPVATGLLPSNQYLLAFYELFTVTWFAESDAYFKTFWNPPAHITVFVKIGTNIAIL